MTTTTARVAIRPDCDICKHVAKRETPEPAVIDGKTMLGPWAYMCNEHYATNGVGIGLGLGQYLEVAL